MIKFRCVMINNERDLASPVPAKIVDLFCLRTQMNTRCSTPYSQTCHHLGKNQNLVSHTILVSSKKQNHKILRDILLIRGEQKNQKTDLTEKTEKKLTEKTEPVQKTD